MKKKTLWMLTLTIATCGIMAFAGGCSDKKKGNTDSSLSGDSAPTYSDEIQETPTAFDVIVTEGEGYKIAAPATVAEGERLEFTVEFDKNFDSANATVQANGVAVACVDGKYTVENVNQHVTLSVKNLARVSYGVLLKAPEGVLLTGNDFVKIGENYSFTVALEDGVTKGADFVVKVNGKAISSTSNTYTVPAEDKDLIVIVSGVVVPYYSVEGLEGEGYKVSVSAQQIMKGKDVSFAVNVDEEYEKLDSYAVTVNGSVVEATDGIYTVKNVQSNVVISVNGLSARQKFTVTYKNCNLTTGTIYVGTLFHLPTPTRPEYIFNGWKDENGEDFVMDYSGDVTVYASWITGEHIDYIAEYQRLSAEMAMRYEDLKAEFKLNYLNHADWETRAEYLEMKGHFTDHESEIYGEESPSVQAFLAEAENIPHTVISKSPEDISVVYELNGEQATYSGYHGSQTIAMGKPFDGGFFALQSPDANNPSLTYYFSLSKLNFKEYCKEYGRVSLFMSGNYAGMTLLCGETPIAYTMAAHVLQRVDIQDGYLYVNGDCRMKLADDVYEGKANLVFTVLRKPSSQTSVNGATVTTGHYYAQWDISNIYGAKRMENYSTTVGETTSTQSIRDNIFSNKNAGEGVTPPAEIALNGATKVYTYEYSAWDNAALDNIALGEYDRVKFFVKATGNTNLWGANGADIGVYFDKIADWTEIKLVKNGNGYDLFVGGVKNGKIGSIANLNAIAFNGAAPNEETGVVSTISYTDLIVEN